MSYSQQCPVGSSKNSKTLWHTVCTLQKWSVISKMAVNIFTVACHYMFEGGKFLEKTTQSSSFPACPGCLEGKMYLLSMGFQWAVVDVTSTILAVPQQSINTAIKYQCKRSILNFDPALRKLILGFFCWFFFFVVVCKLQTLKNKVRW